MRIAILGAGAWGTALGQHAAIAHPVRLWTRDPAHARAMRVERANARYLPGVALTPAITVDADLDATLDWSREDGLLVVATPVAGLRSTLAAIRGRLAGVEVPVPLLWLCKGLERETGLLPHQVVAQEARAWPAVHCRGPASRRRWRPGFPSRWTAASVDEAVTGAAVRAFHHAAARIYHSDDLVGVEIGGAFGVAMAGEAGGWSTAAVGSA